MADLKLELKQVFDAPIEKVWDAWTKPENIKQWLSPEGMINPEVAGELKPGGKYRIVMEGENLEVAPHSGTVIVGGKYLEIDKPNKLSFTWLWEGAPEETHTTKVTVLLKRLTKSKTEVTLIHTGFPDEDMRQEHNRGWNSTFRKLNKCLEGR